MWMNQPDYSIVVNGKEHAFSLQGSASEINLVRGKKINRCNWLGAQIVTLRELEPRLEKEARRTPPKVQAAAIEKRDSARKQLAVIQAQLKEFIPEWSRLKWELGFR